NPATQPPPRDEEPLPVRGRDDQAADEGRRHDVRHRRRLEHDGDLAEELASAEARQLVAGKPDCDLAVGEGGAPPPTPPPTAAGGSTRETPQKTPPGPSRASSLPASRTATSPSRMKK